MSAQGSTELRFKRELGAGRLGLFAKHETICGNINVKYPADFERVLKASTIASRIAIGGEGVNTVASGWPITKRVDGTKGVGREGGGELLKRWEQVVECSCGLVDDVVGCLDCKCQCKGKGKGGEGFPSLRIRRNSAVRTK